MFLKKLYILLFLCSLKGLTHAQITNDLVRNLSKGRLIDTAEDNDLEAFNLLNDEVGKYRVYFTGENHRYRQTNSHLELKYFKYLHQKGGVNTLILETGFSGGWLINRYVQTGDSSIKKYLFKATYSEYHHFYELLRNYYDSLPTDKKFKVEGIDLEREYGSLAKMLLYLMPDSLPSDDSLAFQWEALRAAVGYYELQQDETSKGSSYYRGYYKQSYSLKATLRLVLQHFKRETGKYEKWLGTNFTLFKKAVSGMDDDIQWDSYNYAYQDRIYREMYMGKRLINLLEENPKESYYGQFGRCHTSIKEQEYWCDFYYLRSLATRVNTNPSTKDKVFCIGIYYLDELDYSGEERILRNNLKALREQLKPGVTLIPLEGTDSTVTAFRDKFQYLILFREGKYYEPSQINRRYNNNQYSSGGYDPYYININYAYQIQGFKPGFVKDYLLSNGFVGFKNRMEYHTIQIESTNDKGDGPCSGVEFAWSNNQTQQVNDSVQLSLSGKKYSFFIGGDVLGHDLLALIPAVGFNYYNTILTNTTQRSGAKSTVDPFGYISPDYTIRNPAFTISLNLDFRFTQNFYNFFVKGGYNFDMSDTRWLFGKSAISSSFRSSFTGFLIYGGIGIAIEDM